MFETATSWKISYVVLVSSKTFSAAITTVTKNQYAMIQQITKRELLKGSLNNDRLLINFLKYLLIVSDWTDSYVRNNVLLHAHGWTDFLQKFVAYVCKLE